MSLVPKDLNAPYPTMVVIIPAQLQISSVELLPQEGVRVIVKVGVLTETT